MRDDAERLAAQDDGSELAALNARTTIGDIVGRLQAAAASMPLRPHPDLDTMLSLMDELSEAVVAVTVDAPTLTSSRGLRATVAWEAVCDCSCGGIRR